MVCRNDSTSIMYVYNMLMATGLLWSKACMCTLSKSKSIMSYKPPFCYYLLHLFISNLVIYISPKHFSPRVRILSSIYIICRYLKSIFKHSSNYIEVQRKILLINVWSFYTMIVVVYAHLNFDAALLQMLGYHL